VNIGYIDKFRNAADGPLALRPQGAPQIYCSGVAVLEKVTYLSCERRLAAVDLWGSEYAF